MRIHFRPVKPPRKAARRHRLLVAAAACFPRPLKNSFAQKPRPALPAHALWVYKALKRRSPFNLRSGFIVAVLPLTRTALLGAPKTGRPRVRPKPRRALNSGPVGVCDG